jgi:hypothetical protein
MRKVLIALAGATALTAASAATAQQFTGSTLGCFGPACTVANSSSTGGLTFNSGTFDQAASNGFLAIGSGGSTDTLGLISASTVASDWVNVPFSLQVSFTNPLGTSPSSALYSALISGSVSSNGAGGAFFDFNNTPQTFTYNGGSFSFFVNDLGISAGDSNLALNGVIRATAAVPEPATWAMMLLGFGGIGMAMRRRRRPALAQIA